MTIREKIIRTLGGCSVAFDKDVVDSLEKRVQNASLGEGKRSNPEGLAFIVARNWAISEVRRIASGARRQAKELIAQDEARKENELYERCLKEFDRIYFQLLPKLRQSQPQQLCIVRLICFDGLAGEKLEKALPDTSREQRYKWKARGYKLILTHASEELKEYLLRFVMEGTEYKK